MYHTLKLLTWAKRWILWIFLLNFTALDSLAFQRLSLLQETGGKEHPSLPRAESHANLQEPLQVLPVLVHTDTFPPIETVSHESETLQFLELPSIDST